MRGGMFEDGHLLDASLEGVVRVGGRDDEFAADDGPVSEPITSLFVPPRAGVFVRDQ